MVKFFPCSLILLLLGTGAVFAADPIPRPAREPDRILHPWKEGDWKGKLPDSWSRPEAEETEKTGHMGGITTIRNVSNPELAYFAPAKTEGSSGKGVLICPGGGYNILAWDLEGTEVATFLSSRGIHAWVLKYRLPRKNGDPDRSLPALQDAQRSLSLIRSQAAALQLDPKQLGIMGFSAGGHLAARTATAGNSRNYPALDPVDAVSCRPDWCALIYPAYLVPGEKEAGVIPSPENPPAFLVHSADDPLTWQNSARFFEVLQRHRIPSEMHLWTDGGHGYGMRSPLTPRSWPQLLADWIAVR